MGNRIDRNRLIKLTAVAARAACAILQLVQARDGRSAEPAFIVFMPAEIDTLDALGPSLEGKTALQKTPTPAPPRPGPPGSSPSSIGAVLPELQSTPRCVASPAAGSGPRWYDQP